MHPSTRPFLHGLVTGSHVINERRAGPKGNLKQGVVPRMWRRPGASSGLVANGIVQRNLTEQPERS
eukprot:115990-Chlamydomonas_euryale.AAC.2